MTNPGLCELNALRDLAGRVEELVPAQAEMLRGWRENADALQRADDLNSLAAERALDNLGFELRFIWLQIAHGVCGRYLMSPPHELSKTLPSGQPIQFDYDRANEPKPLEKRGVQCFATPDGWYSECVLFSSGMAAISTLVEVCAVHLDGAKPANPLGLAMFGGYFETWRLLDMHCNPLFGVEYFTENDQFCDHVRDGRVDVAIIEPVAYDWDMAVFDLEALREAWIAAGDKHPRLVIVDASLSADKLAMTDLAPVFGDTPPMLVAFVRSGLKLDQQGLELANVGIVDVYARDGAQGAASRPVDLAFLKQRLTVNRAVTGTGLGAYEMACLEAPWFLDRQSLMRHAGRVFENNATVARLVQNTGGIFAKIAHPALQADQSSAWAVSPFISFQLVEDTVASHGKLVAILVHEAARRALVFDLGSSFGFRGHRFEVIRPLVQLRENESHAGILKIAMGSRKGPSFNGIIELLNEIAGYRDWEALRDAYPNIAPYVKDSAGVYVARPPRP